MARFIRLDVKGNWRGTEHRSSFQGLAGECWCEDECTCNGNWEIGISCYQIDSNHDGIAVEKLREYWMGIAMNSKPADYENMQVTIFEGVKLNGEGADYEDMVECIETILEADAQPFMKKVLEAYEQYKYEEKYGEEKYLEVLSNILADVLQNKKAT